MRSTSAQMENGPDSKGANTICPEHCPGCHHRHMTPGQSENQKMHWLEKKLSPWKDHLLPIKTPPMGSRTGYREKTCLHAGWTDNGWRFGLISDKELIPIHGCPVHSIRVRRAVTAIAGALPDPEYFPLKYYVQSGAQLTLVLKTSLMPDTSWLNHDLQTQLHDTGIQGLWLHLFPSAGKKVFSKPGWHLLWGLPRCCDKDGIVYGPASFQQVFPHLHKIAIDEAEAFLSAGPGDSVMDLYCGTGRTLRRWSGRGALAAGVELSGEAVECARINAPEATVLRGACAQRLVQLDSWFGRYPSGSLMIYANPPRTGLEPDVIDWIIKTRPRKIVYMSCSAGTLARDLEKLSRQRFAIEWIRPYDFFPGTRHVEVLAAMEYRGE